MLDAENPAETNDSSAATDDTAPQAPPAEGEATAPAKKAAAKRTAKKTTTKKVAAKKTTAKRTTKKAAAAEPEAGAAPDAAGTTDAAGEPSGEVSAGPEVAAEATPPAKKTTAKRTTKKAAAKRTTKKAAAPAEEPSAAPAEEPPTAPAEQPSTAPAEPADDTPGTATPPPVAAPLFQPPDPTKAVVTTRKRSAKKVAPKTEQTGPAAEGPEDEAAEEKRPAKKAAARRSRKTAEAEQPELPAEETDESAAEAAERSPEGEDDQGGERRRRRRGGRRRRRSGGGGEDTDNEAAESPAEERSEQGGKDEDAEDGAGTRRRRRRRRSGEGGESDEPEARARKPRKAEDEITALSGSTRLEAKKQRRKEGREAGRRRAPIVSEAEFLARRESVDRVMVIRQREDLTQIAVLEDKVLVEHYVSRESQNSLIGNVYLGRVQNVLPSMEAAFIDIGKGRNAVLYAGEVNWDSLGAKNGQPRKIESVLKSGQPILVQVTKDPVGHKGARLTSQISLPGRFLVYVPDGTTSGISRKLPDTERNRLKTLLKEIVPESAGVIVRTAAEGASEDELTRDVERLTARWEDIEGKVKGGNAPQLLYGEPDLTLKVVRDLFTEDFKKLVIAGDDAWDMVQGYVTHVAPDLSDRLEKYDGQRDVFEEYRIDEQIEKALDRKVWLPSGGSLVIDRTEAMTVVDVNTGKFTGSGGNLEETVTKNNLEAAEEIVRQLRLRDIGGIIVVDFIDMVLESNRDLVLRRMVECLGRDRTRHQVAEVTSLGLVQMTRKRIGTGLLEAFSESCEHCQGRGLILHHEPVDPRSKSEDDSRRGRRGGRGGRGREESDGSGGGVPSPKDIAAMARHEEQPRTPGSGGEAAERADTDAAEVGEERPPGRSRGGRGRGRGRGGDQETKATRVPETEQEQATEPEPAEQPEPAVEPESAVEPEPAGEPKPAEQPESAVEPEQELALESEAAPAPQPEPEPAAVPAGPTVVTTTVRRRARRPAGPPAGAAELASDQPADVEPIAALVEDAEVDGTEVEGAEVDDVGVDSPATPHVPVKKRGRRR